MDYTILFNRNGHEHKNKQIMSIYNELLPKQNEDMTEEWFTKAITELQAITEGINNSTLSEKHANFWRNFTAQKSNEIKSYKNIIKPVEPSRIHYESDWNITDWKNMFERCHRDRKDIIHSILSTAAKTDPDSMNNAWDGLDGANISPDEKIEWMQEIDNIIDKRKLKTKNIVITTNDATITRQDNKTVTVTKEDKQAQLEKERAKIREEQEKELDAQIAEIRAKLPKFPFTAPNGKTYANMNVMAKDFGLGRKTLLYRLTHGYSFEKATANVNYSNKKKEGKKKKQTNTQGKKRHPVNGIQIHLTKEDIGQDITYENITVFCKAYGMPRGSWDAAYHANNDNLHDAAMAMLRKYKKLPEQPSQSAIQPVKSSVTEAVTETQNDANQTQITDQTLSAIDRKLSEIDKKLEILSKMMNGYIQMSEARRMTENW